jgi:hypothetical protein
MVMPRLIIFLFLTFFCSFVWAQKNAYSGFPSIVWPKLYNIQFEKVKDQLGDYDKPVFSAEVRSLNGKHVSLPGYMVPFENVTRGNHFMLSSMPLNACFFCGVGGPESVVEVFLKNPIAYTEKPILVSGILRLNEKDPDKMIYLLENAEFEGLVEF